MKKYRVTGTSGFGPTMWVHLEDPETHELAGFSCVDHNSVPPAGSTVEAEGLGTAKSEVWWNGERIHHLLSEKRPTE